MTWLWVGVVLVLLCCATRWARRRYSAQPANGINHKRPRRRHRPGDGHRRRLAHAQARELIAALASERHEASARPAVGVAPQGGETIYGQAGARLETWSTTTTWVTDIRASWWGRRARSITREVAAEGWRDLGDFTWLLTSARTVGRSVRSGQLVSVPWASLAGVDMDERREVVVIDLGNGWSGRFSGPGVLPVAVLVVAACRCTEGRLAFHASPTHPTARTNLRRLAT